MATSPSSIEEVIERINKVSLTVDRAVALTGSETGEPTSHMTIRRAIRSGKLPSIFVLGKYRIWPEDLRNWWAAR
jgi:excisionase family DNA binding protein